MPATFVKGDLFDHPEIRAYAFGCSAAGAMDGGVAAAFKKRFPAMFAEYAQRCADGRFKLGDVLMFTEAERVLFPLAIQEHWKTRSKIAALAKALKKAIELCENQGIERLGLPRIGAGVGGLDWPRVKKVVNELGAETTVELRVFEQFVRAPAAPVEPT